MTLNRWRLKPEATEGEGEGEGEEEEDGGSDRQQKGRGGRNNPVQDVKQHL